MQDNHMHSKLFCQLSQYENLFICVNTTLLSNHWNCSIFFNREQISFSCKYLRSLSAHIRILPMNREMARWLSVSYMELKVLRRLLAVQSPKPTKRSPRDHPAWKVNCVYGYMPSILCSTASSFSGSVGESISVWPSFKGPRFESWLDLVFLWWLAGYGVQKKPRGKTEG